MSYSYSGHMWSDDSSDDEGGGGGGGPYCCGDVEEHEFFDVGVAEEVRCMENDPENLTECVSCNRILLRESFRRR